MRPTIRLDSGEVIDPNESTELTKAQLMAVLKQSQRRAAGAAKKTQMAVQITVSRKKRSG